mmetsp:Transcript_3325/g.447  ORF Transcript_3325/g.447 Transcript_3325/m.447 type:complete len:81 (-) Transcript_3325:23-265(-)
MKNIATAPHLTYVGGINCKTASPTTAATAVIMTSTVTLPRNTASLGSFIERAAHIRNVLSPNSDIKIATKELPTALKKVA